MTDAIHSHQNQLSENQVRLRVATCIGLTFGVPAVSFYGFLSLIELPGHIADHIHLGPMTYTFSPVFIVLTMIVIDFLLRRAFDSMRQVPDNQSVSRVQIRRFADVAVAGLVFLGLYLVLGIAASAWEASLMTDHPFTLPDLFFTLLAIAIFYIYIAVPNALYGLTLFGRVLGPRLGGRRIVPTIVRNILSGPAVAGIIIVCFAAYGALYEHAVDEAILFLAFSLMLYAILVSWLALEGYRFALSPLRQYLEARESGVDSSELLPSSADETGAAVWELKELFDRLQGSYEEVSHSQARFQDFAEAASDFFFELDSDLRFSYISERIDELTGYTPDDFVGTKLEQSPADRSGRELRDRYEEIEARQPFRNLRQQFFAKDGNRLIFEISGVPVFSRDGSFAGYRGAGRDVTDLVEAREKLEEQTHALAQSQKMEAVGQLTGGIAHDFNNLLTVVIGNLELMRATNLPSEAEDSVANALDAVDRGAILVQRLLAFSRKQPLSPSIVNPTELLQRMTHLLERTLGEDITITLESEDSELTCFIDPQQLENAVLNLAINARDAMPEGGELKLNVRQATAGEGIEVDPGDYLVVEVTDNGIGMDPDVAEAAFEPFFTTKDVGKGSGLGLSMVYGLMKQSRGTAEITSSLGGGTKVSLWIPEINAGVTSSPSAVPRQQVLSGNGERLLVVEDDDAVRDMLERMLSGQGFNPVVVPDAEHGLELFNSDEEFDLVLTDIVLTGEMNGIELGRKIKLSSPHTKVLYLSGYSDRASEISRDYFLKKPFTMSQLADKIAFALRRA